MCRQRVRIWRFSSDRAVRQASNTCGWTSLDPSCRHCFLSFSQTHFGWVCFPGWRKWTCVAIYVHSLICHPNFILDWWDQPLEWSLGHSCCLSIQRYLLLVIWYVTQKSAFGSRGILWRCKLSMSGYNPSPSCDLCFDPRVWMNASGPA
jgi:hypothetical protein